MDKETLRMQMLAGIITESEYKAKLNEGEISSRGHAIQINGPQPERFFSDDYIATLKNQKGDDATIYKHPEEGDYYVIVKEPYDKRKMLSTYYEIEADTIPDLEGEFIESGFMSSEENIGDFIIDGELR